MSKSTKRCLVCGRKLSLYKEADYDLEELNEFAFASRKVPEYMHYQLDECINCHILHAYCPIKNHEIFEKYIAADYDSNREADDAARTYLHYLRKYVPDFSKYSALDIGTGNGSYLLELKKAGVQKVTGVEPSMAPVKQADSSVRNFIINDVFSKELIKDAGGGKYGMVTLFQTIEHIPDTKKLFQDLKEVLSENGILYIVCHDYRSIINRVLGRKSPIYDIEHLQIFSRRGIYRLFQKSGFHDINIFTLWNRYSLQYWCRLFPFGNKFKGSLLKFLEKTGIGKIKIPINVGNIGIIARKKSSL